MNTLHDGLEWYESVFKYTNLYDSMKKTTENSPWHRESSVAVHTDMVVNQYSSLCRTSGTADSKDSVLGLLACIFHDIAKPRAKTEKFSEERGKYFAFHGHELMSARIFENYAVSNNLLFGKDLFKVCWMIEHHLPWGITNTKKVNKLFQTANYVGIDTYTNVLLADQYGRIADDQENKNKKALEWIDKFKHLNLSLAKFNDKISHRYPKLDIEGNILYSGKIMFMPIGASGSGKSTLWAYLDRNRDLLDIFSLDRCRLEWYDSNNYANAWHSANQDPLFAQRTREEFAEYVKCGRDIYVDNTNLTTTTRAFYLDLAKKKGYKTVALWMPNTIQTLLNRQNTRKDKCVPEDAVIRQYFSLKLPMIGEFDHIGVVQLNNHDVNN